MKKFTVVFLINAATTLFTIAQNTSEYQRYKLLYPGEPAVVISNTENIRIDVVDRKLSIKAETSREQLLLDNRAGYYSEHSIAYDDFRKITEIEASTFIPRNNSYKEIKVKDFTTSERLSKSVFFDGQKTVSFFYPSLSEGAKMWLHHVQEFSQPQLFPSFYFQENIPVVTSVYTIDAPKDVEIGWKIFNLPDSAIEFTKQVQKSRIVYSWKVKDIKEFKREESAPDYLYSLSHMIAWIKSFKVDGVETPVLKKASDLYQWYYSISKDCNKDESPELKILVDSLTRNSRNDLEKVKNIYYWVQNNIKYIAIEDGMGGFVPRGGKLVYERRYGDCKDMASIIQAMLTHANIPSHLTWIGTRNLPYKYEQVPTPQVDNHMITTYIDQGKYYYLDATNSFTPFGIPSGFIQGKQALIGKGNSSFEIKEVEIVDRMKNKFVDSVSVQIDGKMLTGKGVASFYGYNRSEMVQALSHHLADKKKFLRDVLYKGSNKFLIDSYEVESLSEKDKPLKVRYDFNVEDYVKVVGNELFLNLNMNRKFFFEDIAADRKAQIEKDFKEEEQSVVRFKIPAGYIATYVPENAHYQQEKFGFEILYKKEKDFIVITQNLKYDFLMLEKGDFEAWNRMIKELKKVYKEVIVLEKAHN